MFTLEKICSRHGNATFAAIFTPVGRYLLTGVNMAANVAFTMSATDFL